MRISDVSANLRVVVSTQRPSGRGGGATVLFTAPAEANSDAVWVELDSHPGEKMLLIASEMEPE
jgi:hypothetical protein